jgi:hypothetical protein
LHLAGTGLELGIRVFCPASVKVPGSGAIAAKRLLDIVRSLPDGEVRVRALENHWVQIGSGRSTFKLAADTQTAAWSLFAVRIAFPPPSRQGSADCITQNHHS